MSTEATSLAISRFEPIQSLDAPVVDQWMPIPQDPYTEALQSDFSCWERFKNCFRRKSALRCTIEEMGALPNLDNNWPDHLQALSTAFESYDYHILRAQLREILKKLSQQQLGQLFEKLVTAGIEGKGLDALHNCLRLFTVEDLEQLFKTAIEAKEVTTDTLIDSLALVEEQYRQMITTTKVSAGKQHATSCLSGVHTFLDTLFVALSIGEFGKAPSSAWEASNLLEIYGKVLGAPLLVFTALSTFCTPLVALVTAASIVIGLLALATAYVKWWKPCPENFEGCSNLTTEAMHGRLPPVFVREDEVSEAFDRLSGNNDTHRKHVIFVGPPGVGKSHLRNAMAQRMVNGDVPEQFKDAKMMQANAVEAFLSNTAYDDKTGKLMARAAPHMKQLVFFCEEFQSILEDKNARNRFLSYFDTNHNSFWYFVATMTEENYNKHIANSKDGMNRRFHKIPIEPTKADETLLIMREMINREAPDVNVSEETLRSIFDQTKELPDMAQPVAATNVLSKAISEVRARQGEGFTSKKLRKKMRKLAKLSSFLRSDPNGEQAVERTAEVGKLKARIDALKVEQAEVRKKCQELGKLTLFNSQQNEKLYATALQIQKSDDPLSQEVVENKKRFLFLHHFMNPLMRAKINAVRTELPEQYITEVSQDMAEKIITADLEQQKKAKEERTARAAKKAATEPQQKSAAAEEAAAE